MATQKPTPEEKLFAVIQGSKATPIRPHSRAASLASLGAQLSLWIGPITLPRVNRVLTGGIILLGLVVLGQPLMVLMMSSRIDRLMGMAHERATPNIPAPLAGLRPLDEYLPKLLEQDTFRVGQVANNTRTPDQSTQSTEPDIKAALATLRLVGISWGDEPTAMVEQNHQTYFLKVGDTIGTFTVKEVLKDRVILRMGMHDTELF